MAVQIEKFIWDLTYACPLRCVHCYSESGRRAPRTLPREDAQRVVDLILSAKPKRLSISGGEPLLTPWCTDVMRRFHQSGIAVTIFTSGWVMNEDVADRLADSATDVAVSIDGPNEEVHDTIRGRRGGFTKTMSALDVLQRVKRERRGAGRECYSLGIDYTLTKSGSEISGLEEFVDNVTTRFPELSFIRFGAVIPSGLAAEPDFEATELLSIEELSELLAAKQRLTEIARNDVEISMTDVRYFLPRAETNAADVDIALIEPDGALRAFPIYEAKVGNVLEEPLEVLWPRVMAWRSDPFVVEQMRSIQTINDWARVARTLDRRYGSDEDRQRIAQRGQGA